MRVNGEIESESGRERGKNVSEKERKNAHCEYFY